MAENVTKVLPSPVGLESVNHGWDDDASQLVFDDTSSDTDPAASDDSDSDEEPKARVGALLKPANWVTAIVAVATGLPTVVENTTVPVRVVPLVFDWAVNVTGSLFTPFFGVSVTKPKPTLGVAVTHDGAEDTFQEVFDGVLTNVLPPGAPGIHVDIVVDNFGEPLTAARPSATQASMTSRPTTSHDIRPKPWAPHPVPHSFSMINPLAS